jgi:YHS domain-containing protein
VPGAPIDPALFVVHESKIYGFATPDCVHRFENNPSEYLKP